MLEAAHTPLLSLLLKHFKTIYFLFFNKTSIILEIYAFELKLNYCI